MARTIKNCSLGEDFLPEIESLNLIKTGHHNIFFENWDTAGVPTIKAGSSIELNGIIYTSDSDIKLEAEEEGLLCIIADPAGGSINFRYELGCEYKFDTLKRGFYNSSGKRVIASLVYSAIDFTYRSKTNMCEENIKSRFTSHPVIVDGNPCAIGNLEYLNGFFYCVGINNLSPCQAYLLKTCNGKDFEILHTESSQYSFGIPRASTQIVDKSIYFTYYISTFGINKPFRNFISLDGNPVTSFDIPDSSDFVIGSYDAIDAPVVIKLDNNYLVYSFEEQYKTIDFVNFAPFNKGHEHLSIVKYKDMVLSVGRRSVSIEAKYSKDGVIFQNVKYILKDGKKTYSYPLSKDARIVCIDTIVLIQSRDALLISTDGFSFYEKSIPVGFNGIDASPRFHYLNGIFMAITRSCFISRDFGITWENIFPTSGVSDKVTGVSGGNYFYIFGNMRDTNKKYAYKTKDFREWEDISLFSTNENFTEITNLHLEKFTKGADLILFQGESLSQLSILEK